MAGSLIIGREVQEDTDVTDLDEENSHRLIDGFFYEPFPDTVSQFTGAFCRPKGPDYDVIEGLLEDAYGRSRIEGLLAENKTLNFTKTYRGRPPIEYKFSFDKESGLYIGAWQGKDAFNGHAACKLDAPLVQSDADFILNFFKSFDVMTDTQKAQAIIGYMVGEGQLNVSRDPETDEEMFSLSEEGERLAGNTPLTSEERRVIDETVRQMREENLDEQAYCDEAMSEDDISF